MRLFITISTYYFPNIIHCIYDPLQMSYTKLFNIIQSYWTTFVFGYIQFECHLFADRYIDRTAICDWFEEKKSMCVVYIHKLWSMWIKCNENWIFFLVPFVLYCFAWLGLAWLYDPFVRWAWCKIKIVAGFSTKDATPCASASARGHIQINDQRTSNTSNSSTPTID